MATYHKLARTYYKLARPDGWDFRTGGTINYRKAIGQMVQPPNANPTAQLCSPGVLHASLRAEDCFQGASIPCSLYEIEGNPVCTDTTKAGFVEMRVLRELDPVSHFKWRYAQAASPMNPLSRTFRSTPTRYDVALLQQWDSVWDSVRASVRDSVRASVGNSVWDSVWNSVWAGVGVSVWDSVRDSVGDSVWDSMRASVRDSVRDSVWASMNTYTGWIFAPVVTNWMYITQRKGQYPFVPAVSLWQRGLAPSYDGQMWRLHSGPNAQIVWQGRLQEAAKGA